MTAAEQLLIGEPERRPLLHASIVANADREYSVALKQTEATSPAEDHYVRFALHYYARVLYELVRTDRSVRDLPAVIDRIISGSDGWRGNLFAAGGLQGSVTAVVRQPVGDVAVVLRRAGFRDFEVDGDFRLRGRMLALSVIAVLDAILPRLSGDALGSIFAALANMNVSYTLTHHYRDPHSYREVPTIAYHAAAFV